MKKFLLILFSCVFATRVYAHGNEWLGAGVLFKDTEWTPVQVSLWPIHLCSPRSDVYGIAASPGFIGFAQDVYGISCGIIFLQRANYGITAGIYPVGGQNNGISVGAINSWESNNGVSMGIVNCIYGNSGSNILQIGAFNSANDGLQIGLLNYNPNALIPWMPLFNFSSVNKNQK